MNKVAKLYQNLQTHFYIKVTYIHKKFSFNSASCNIRDTGETPRGQDKLVQTIEEC